MATHISNKEVVKYEGGGYDVEITIAPATYLMGIVRSTLMLEERNKTGLESTEGVSASRIGELLGRVRYYPACVACTEKVLNHGKKKKLVLDDSFTADDFLALPEQLVESWIMAAFRVNPHWDPTSLMQEEDEEEGTEDASGEEGDDVDNST